jgi:hypothetical protein
MLKELFLLSIVGVQAISCSLDYSTKKESIKSSNFHQVEFSADLKSEKEALLEFVNKFFLERSVDTLYIRFLMPSMEFNVNYYLDSQGYIDQLRKSGWFSENYIKNDSLKIMPCVKEFNDKKYTIDLEGSFFDECTKCDDLFYNRITGLHEDYVSKFNHKAVVQMGNNFIVIGYCLGVNEEKGDQIKMFCVKDNLHEYKIDKIEIIR